jgi:hypothetical protein
MTEDALLKIEAFLVVSLLHFSDSMLKQDLHPLFWVGAWN